MFLFILKSQSHCMDVYVIFVLFNLPIKKLNNVLAELRQLLLLNTHPISARVEFTICSFIDALNHKQCWLYEKN